MELKLSHYHVTSPRFVDEHDGIARRVVFATRTAEVRVLDDGSWRCVADGRCDALRPDLVEDLIAIELLVPAGQDELATMLRRNSEAINANPVLSLVVCPTAACQLGCPYCGQEHAMRWLTEQHQAAFLRLTDARLRHGDYRRVQLCWFGAEPLLGLKVIRTLTPRMRELAERHSCAYSSRIITNGLALTEHRATELVREHSVTAIDITLDGDADSHDARRHTKTGKATFARIFRNLVALARRDDLEVDIKLRTNVDSSNWRSVSTLIEMLADAGIHRRVGYYVAPIHSWGNDADKMALERDEFAAREIEWYAEMMLRGFEVGLIPPRKPIVCLAVQPEGMLVDASGNLFNCTEAPYVPAYSDGQYGIGDVNAGEDPGRRRLLGDFNQRIAGGAYPCSTCRMLPVCGGACPKGWHEGWQPCPSALDNMPERLLLAYAATVSADESPVAAAAQ